MSGGFGEGTGAPLAGGIGVCAAVAAALGVRGFTDVFTSPPSAMLCTEPIVLSCGAWERLARLSDGRERGVQAVGVLACRDTPSEAEAACRAAEAALRGCAWEARLEGWRVRVAACDSGAPEPRGRDGSGRWLWGFDLLCTVVRDVEADTGTGA